MDVPPAGGSRARRRGVGSLVALVLALASGVGPAIPVSSALAADRVDRPASPPPVTEPAGAVALPDTFELHPDPPPPVGRPAIPWLAPSIPDDPSSHKAFIRRSFPLPRSVAWDALFPTDRWVGPPTATGPVDATGLPMRELAAGRYAYSPTNLGLQALRRLEGYRRTGDPAYLASARRMAEKLRELGVPEGDRIWLPFTYDDRKARMQAPWVNALGQAVALALFSRLHRLEGRPEDLAFADGLFRSFTQLKRVNGPWVSDVDAHGYLWFEHYPGGLRGRVLNAHAYAVLALRDYWQETGTEDALRWLEGGLATLRDRGPEFRRPGTWSRYNLRNPAAHANYHLFHVRQLRALAAASGDPWFGRFAELLARDFRSRDGASWMHTPRTPAPGVVPTAPATGPDAELIGASPGASAGASSEGSVAPSPAP
jgi:hypothetical protein